MAELWSWIKGELEDVDKGDIYFHGGLTVFIVLCAIGSAVCLEHLK